MYSRNGITYTLKKSKFQFSTINFTFYFSSEKHLQKFCEQLQENRDIINYSLSKRFNLTVIFNELADVILYSKIETRGFFIKNINGKEFDLKKNIVLKQ